MFAIQKRSKRILLLCIIALCVIWMFILNQRHFANQAVIQTDLKVTKNPKISNVPIESLKKVPNESSQHLNYYEDGLHTDWLFRTPKNYESHQLRRWSEPIRSVNVSESGRGENGAAFIPTKDEEDQMNKLKREHNYNLFASEKMSLHRSLPDYRFPECRELVYPDLLPTTSVVIIFHNEAWSTLLRTVWSIIDRSPHELIEEIILVDDLSTWDFLKRPLDDYVEMLPVRTRVIRTEKREGLIRARLIGARNATGSILTFLDAHMECTEGWLQPILARIASDRSVITVPFLDSVSSDDMRYSASWSFNINGLRWYLLFYWMNIPQRELLRTHNDKTAPIRSPSHVGCAFSVDRDFFFEIGSYDEGMDIWGSENVELAFRVWLCGGSLEILPCSRVGHLYRISTYSFDGDAGAIKTRNNNRLVEVWMDDFKDLFYAMNPSARKVSPGDITERINLKKKLKCKNFRWYLENIFPESNLLKEYIMTSGFINVAENKCMDLYSRGLHGQLGVYQCHEGGGNQFFAFAKSGEIITGEEHCLGRKNDAVVSVECSENIQDHLWNFNEKEQWIVHKESGLCMRNNQTDVILDKCTATDPRFKWKFK